MNWYLKAFKQYFDFDGRARRKEYWYFQLFNIIFLYSLMFISGIFINLSDTFSPFLILVGLYLLASIIPSLAVTVRRLHDAGYSGWYYFIGLIPLIGGIWLLVLLVGDSVAANQWGANPKITPNEINEIGTE